MSSVPVILKLMEFRETTKWVKPVAMGSRAEPLPCIAWPKASTVPSGRTSVTVPAAERSMSP